MRPLLAPLIAALTLAASAGAQPVADHLKCYKVKDALSLAGMADLNTPRFGADPGCTISTAKLFCVPATKTNVSAIDKSTGNPIIPQPVAGPDPGDRICYKVKCPQSVADQQVTDQFGTRILTKFKTVLVCGPAVTGGTFQRLVDNGDGTVTDNSTGLQWEKKDGADGVANLADPHDVDNNYVWTISPSPPPYAADGPAFTDFLSRLNACTSSDGSTVTAAFAAHCDWRLPTIAELQTIVDLSAAGCGSGSPCIDPIFGPTAASRPYWSSTTVASDPSSALHVVFFDGSTYFCLKGCSDSVRAVRRRL